MPRFALVIAALLAVAGVVQQLALPPLLESEGAKRLEQNGGDVSVSLSAFPALRLLADDGDSIEVTGSDLELDLEEPVDALGRLDGFDEVRLELTDTEAGPLTVNSFELLRGEDDDAYSLRLDGETSPRELARYIGRQTGGSLGGVLGGLFADAVLPASGAPLPLRLEADVRSEGGRAEADEASGSLAGIPAGPLAELVADAVVRRL